MFRTSLLAIAVCLLPAMAQAATLPSPDGEGDYPQRTTHRYWVVVDPAGVNCRWSEDAPKSWYAPDASFPQMDVENWQVVKQFQRNQALLANLAPAGFAMLGDDNSKPWLKVSLGTNESICLVRANSKFIRPYEKTDARPATR